MDCFEDRTPPRTSATYIRTDAVKTLQALRFAEELRESDPRCASIVTLNPRLTMLPPPSVLGSKQHGGRQTVVASCGTALDRTEQKLTSNWLKCVDTTKVYSIPRELRGAMGAFRVLATAIASPVARFGVLALTRPVGELCPNSLRRTMEQLAAEWALQLEQQERAACRTRSSVSHSEPPRLRRSEPAAWLSEHDILANQNSPAPAAVGLLGVENTKIA